MAAGRLDGGKSLIHESILGTRFEAAVTAEAPGFDRFPVCIPSVRREGRLVGRMECWIDPEDSLFAGFMLR